eukprot:11366478-Alexandrium_andersonii.AAC.1
MRSPKSCSKSTDSAAGGAGGASHWLERVAGHFSGQPKCALGPGGPKSSPRGQRQRFQRAQCSKRPFPRI